MKKLILLAFVAILMISCQNEEDEFIKDSILSTDNIDQSKLVDFMGLKVNHRFSKPLDSKSESNFMRSTTVLDSTTVITIVESLLSQFPYRLEGDFSQSDLNMIKSDFPLLSTQEIADSQEIIELYYEINFQNECEFQYNLSNGGGPNNPNFTRNNNDDDDIYGKVQCMINGAGYGYSNFAALFAIYKASKSAIKFSGEKFPNDPYADSQRDTYRHILWNSLLSHHYLRLFSKAKRTAFAKAITDANELCPNDAGLFNEVDAKAMDLHNNKIGRDLWDNSTSYKTFLGVTLGLSLPSISSLKLQVSTYANTAKFVNSLVIGKVATVNEINNFTPQNKAVYINNGQDSVAFEQFGTNKISIASLNYSLLNNNLSPVTFHIESHQDVLGIQVGDRLSISYEYSCQVDLDEGPGGPGGPLLSGSDYQVNFNGMGTITQSLGNNKYLLVPDNAGWIVNGTPGATASGCTFSTQDYSAIFNF